MATSIEKYQEGGVPSNMQVLGVRTADLASVRLEAKTVVAGDIYKLFDLSADEVVLSIGLTVESASAAGTVEVNLDTTAVTGLGAVVLTAVGKTAGTVPAAGATGNINVIVTGATTDVDITVWAVVAQIKSLVTHTVVDTPAP